MSNVTNLGQVGLEPSAPAPGNGIYEITRTPTIEAEPGRNDWIPTPPAFASPITPWMGQMVPFTMRSASQFLPDPPPPLTSMEWASDYNEVKAVGAEISTARTPQETENALFWTENTSVQYARAMRNLAGARGLPRKGFQCDGNSTSVWYLERF